MYIRQAKLEELPILRQLYEQGRKTQSQSGNPNQWASGYPSDDLIRQELKAGSIWCLVDESKQIQAVMSVLTEADPTYETIDGAWLNDSPYATIHRLASSGQIKGAGQELIRWVQERYDNVRIDTHQDNQQMLHILEKLNFQPTGTIYLDNGEPRLAFHYVREKTD